MDEKLESAKEGITDIIKERDYGSGVTYSRIKKFFKGSDELLNEALDELIDSGYVAEIEDNRFSLSEKQKEKPVQKQEPKKEETREKPPLISQIITFAYNAFSWFIAFVVFLAFLGSLSENPVASFFFLVIAVFWTPFVKLKLGHKFGITIFAVLVMGFLTGSAKPAVSSVGDDIRISCYESCSMLPEKITCEEFIASEYCKSCYDIPCENLGFKCSMTC